MNLWNKLLGTVFSVIPKATVLQVLDKLYLYIYQIKNNFDKGQRGLIQSVAFSQSSQSCSGLICKACTMISTVSWEDFPKALCREHSADFTVSLYLMQTLCEWNNISSYLCFWSCIVFLQEKHRLYENKSSMWWAVLLVMFSIIVSCTYSCGKTQVSPSRNRQVVEYRSAKQECYREALPNTETISLPDVHTKCCSTVEHSLQLLIHIHMVMMLLVTRYRSSVMPLLNKQRKLARILTRTLLPILTKWRMLKNEIMNFCDNSIKLDISLHFDQLFPL